MLIYTKVWIKLLLNLYCDLGSSSLIQKCKWPHNDSYRAMCTFISNQNQIDRREKIFSFDHADSCDCLNVGHYHGVVVEIDSFPVRF